MSSIRSRAHRVLVVDDDERIRTEVVDALRADGAEVVSAASLADARAALQRDALSLIVLDLGLPDGDGLDLCRELRAAGADTSILVLTARDGPEQRVRGLDVGADDYLVKPFYMPELRARVRGLFRRGLAATAEDRLEHGELWVDLRSRMGGGRDGVFELKPREFDLMAFLMQHPDRAWTRAQLLERVWGEEFGGGERTVDQHVARLRAEVEDNPRDPQWIETVWGVGYRLRGDV